MQSALDSTALMVSKDAQNLDPELIEPTAKKYFAGVFQQGQMATPAVTAKFDTPLPGSFTLKVTASSSLPAVFSQLIGKSSFEIEASAAAGADAVELHTGAYANAGSGAVTSELERLRSCAGLAAAAGLRVFAGHGLDYANVGPVSAIPKVEELNIGHAIVSRALLVGFEAAVRQMLERMARG